MKGLRLAVLALIALPTLAVAQKTVVIPGSDGLFVLQLNADGTEDQMGILMDATNIIDEQTTITPAP